MGERVAVAIDLEHTLAQLLPAAVDWHNEAAAEGAAVQVADLTSSEWMSQLDGGVKGDASEKWAAFYESTQFTRGVSAVDGAKEILKPLRKFFTLIAVADRPRTVEKVTREWLDSHFAGVFDKVVFLEKKVPTADAVSRKMELYNELHIKVAIGSDPSMLEQSTTNVDRALLVGSVPWALASNTQKITVAADWAATKETLQKVISDLDVKPLDKALSGPKLARFMDDLVTVSTRKSPSFYANMISSKFSAQRQDSIRLQAGEAAISTAVQTAELLKAQQHATVTKISTRYMFKKFKGGPGHRVPKIEIVLQKASATA